MKHEISKLSSSITTVFFDVGGVLLEDYVDKKIVDLADKFKKDQEIMLQLRKQYRPLADSGQITDKEFWRRVLKAVGITAVAEDWKIDNYEKAIKGGIDIPIRMKQHGYRIAILSNDSKESSDLRRKKYNFDDIFDEIIFSNAYGIIKPNAGIFELALNKLNVRPEQSLFIDDREENVKCSRKIGIYSILFENVDQLIDELKDLGIDIL